MKKLYILFFFLPALTALGQKVSLNPTVTPALFRPTDEITVTYDVTGTSLASLSNAWIWVWIPGKNTDAKYNVNPANSNTTLTNNAKFTKSVVEGRTLFTITFTPADFFSGSIASETKIGMLLKGNDWSNGQTSDHVADFWDGSFQVKLTSPVETPIFIDPGNELLIEAETPVDADFELYVNDVLVDEQDGIRNYAYTHTVAGPVAEGEVRLVASSATHSSEVSFEYFPGTSPEAARPAGIIPGINYDADQTVATLCLWAPDKKAVYVRGDFNDWEIVPDYQMKRDGEYFWITLTGLTPGTEYGFQYLLDGGVYIADPYADKILDPDDQYIAASVYPNLKPFPQQALSPSWYFNRVAVLQTGQQQYQWQFSDYEMPAKENLVIYEVLIRDFFGSNGRTYKNLADTLGYLKRLGVNAIELMPIMEFNGNESWGYNPAFMFAPDKYYGPKNELKAFIDKCHGEGIAVILDIAMNHQDMPNSYVMMDFDFGAGRPNPSNKWFNPEARHPFNVFFDMNHESPYTQAYLDTVNHYWLNEYRVDGYRFDLSKGFTQKNTGQNVGAWSEYDASRIALLKRMADRIWEHSPNAIVILEHLAVEEEEKELAEYRADEGKGMMLWGNMNHAFNQVTMGYGENSDISKTYYAERGWDYPHLVSYMESHDEERLMYKNLQYGNNFGTYSVKDKNTSIDRIKAASVLFYSIPGPKMLWQFGELAYDYSINLCGDGTIDEDCRVHPNPPKWEYKDDIYRASLFDFTADLIKLHTTYSVFTNGQATVTTGTSLIKQVTVKNSPYTTTPSGVEEMNVQAVGNFEVQEMEIAVNFPHTGIWYDYYDGGSQINVTSTPHSVTLKPGEYKLYTDVSIGAGPVPPPPPVVTSTESTLSSQVYAFPNPTTGRLFVQTPPRVAVRLTDLRGVPVQLNQIAEDEYDISGLSPAIYLLTCEGSDGARATIKVVKTR